MNSISFKKQAEIAIINTPSLDINQALDFLFLNQVRANFLVFFFCLFLVYSLLKLFPKSLKRKSLRKVRIQQIQY